VRRAAGAPRAPAQGTEISTRLKAKSLPPALREEELLINTRLDEKVFADASNEVDKRAVFTSWFNNAKIPAELLYYDRDLELPVQQQSAQGKCGG
jgi:hypothetical protein